MSTQNNVMAVIQQTPPAQIAELEFVQNKFIQNYNACHKEQNGEMMYHRQLVHFKQAINNSDQLKKADPFSLYACFVTAAVNGYSMDPNDDEVYIIPRGGKAWLQPQAGARLRRLIRTGQVMSAEQVKLVYQGDDFKVMGGRVIQHVENFQSETIVAAYIRFIIDETGADRYFIYRKSDWESWKKKSQMPNGENWAGGIDKQPVPGFLRTKIVLHACKEKCWATGQTPAAVETYSVEIEADDAPELPAPAADAAFTPTMIIEPAKKPAKEKKSPVQSNDHYAEEVEPEGITVEPTKDDETF